MKVKLIHRYVGLYKFFKRVRSVAYDYKCPNELGTIHRVFYFPMLKKFIWDPVSIYPLEGLGVKGGLSYEEVLVEIFDHQAIKLRNKEFFSIIVLLRNHFVEGTTWEAQADTKSHYPHRFPSNS